MGGRGVPLRAGEVGDCRESAHSNAPPFVIDLRGKRGRGLLHLVGMPAHIEDDAGRIPLGSRAGGSEWTRAASRKRL